MLEKRRGRKEQYCKARVWKFNIFPRLSNESTENFPAACVPCMPSNSAYIGLVASSSFPTLALSRQEEGEEGKADREGEADKNRL